MLSQFYAMLLGFYFSCETNFIMQVKFSCARFVPLIGVARTIKLRVDLRIQFFGTIDNPARIRRSQGRLPGKVCLCSKTEPVRKMDRGRL